MSYVIVQTEAAPPAADSLKRAFASHPAFTAADAIKVACESCGLLVKHLALDDANRLKSALQAEGVAVEVVEAGRLPALVEAKLVRRAEVTPDALVIYDQLGRPMSMPWPQVTLVVAGRIRHFGISESRTQHVEMAYSPLRGLHRQVVTDVRHKVEDDARYLVDIVLGREAMRFQIEAESFLFGYLFNEPKLPLPEKIARLLQLLVQHAPQAVLNRGARGFLSNPPQLLVYASKAALNDEATWHLWQLERGG